MNRQIIFPTRKAYRLVNGTIYVLFYSVTIWLLNHNARGACNCIFFLVYCSDVGPASTFPFDLLRVPDAGPAKSGDRFDGGPDPPLADG
jgi:hypothetical protein